MNKPCKVLIVDDSVVFRSQIRIALENVDEIKVVGFASNGRQAIEFLKTQPVDLITLDLEMPEMNGLQTLEEMKRLNIQAKVIIFSAHTKSGAEMTLAALNAGANDFLAKPNGLESEFKTPAEAIKKYLLPKILQFINKDSKEFKDKENLEKKNLDSNLSPFHKVNWDLFFPKIVVIASSTGGPIVLEKFFSLIKGPLSCPILIVQHMPPVFTGTLAERLAKLSSLPVIEAKHLDPLQSGHVYIAPGNFHLRVIQEKNTLFTALDQEPQKNSVRPAADHLFESVTKYFKNKCLGIVLTGMGSDGKDGAIAIKNAGGGVVIQNKETCAVFGMPGAVHDIQAFDECCTIEKTVDLLVKLNVCSKKNIPQENKTNA